MRERRAEYALLVLLMMLVMALFGYEVHRDTRDKDVTAEDRATLREFFGLYCQTEAGERASDERMGDGEREDGDRDLKAFCKGLE